MFANPNEVPVSLHVDRLTQTVMLLGTFCISEGDDEETLLAKFYFVIARGTEVEQVRVERSGRPDASVYRFGN